MSRTCSFFFFSIFIDQAEVIFNGGEPLLVKDALLSQLTKQLGAISHMVRLRIHTRLKIIIIHCNHANEIDNVVIAALNKLHHANIVLLNQSVLLKNVNDNLTALIHLSERLFTAHVLPYYLHLLDHIQGCAHFC